ncbi:hypothetical protein J40TS1_34420 [Paenibacillus montaniterrae]|uniref:Uncharacterized protein n=1 Tax=Paenibacillus montaniterrae TaxID=429341 RepID=A0A919YQY5_9BACL|nr:hypothetical protein [Paenibacillus montaniterrae]GIP17800.1 hypothetical protein J40TS1_34420 [Paenibacillus montaniterrae]
MKEVIYDNLSSKLVADATGGVVELKQYFDGEEVGAIFLTAEESKKLGRFLKKLEVNPCQ